MPSGQSSSLVSRTQVNFFHGQMPNLTVLTPSYGNVRRNPWDIHLLIRLFRCNIHLGTMCRLFADIFTRSNPTHYSVRSRGGPGRRTLSTPYWNALPLFMDTLPQLCLVSRTLQITLNHGPATGGPTSTPPGIHWYTWPVPHIIRQSVLLLHISLVSRNALGCHPQRHFSRGHQQ